MFIILVLLASISLSLNSFLSSPPPPPSLKGSKSGTSPLPFLPRAEQQGPDSVLNSSTLLSSLSISALAEYKGRRNLSELLLPDTSPVTLEGRTGKNLSHKVIEECESTVNIYYIVYIHPCIQYAMYKYRVSRMKMGLNIHCLHKP